MGARRRRSRRRLNGRLFPYATTESTSIATAVRTVERVRQCGPEGDGSIQLTVSEGLQSQKRRSQVPSDATPLFDRAALR